MTKVDMDWADRLVGRDWEIYWESSGDDAMDTDNRNDGNEEKVEDEEETDWYDGRVVSVQTGKDVLFRVTFVGDDTVYEMRLQPRLVRPSARAWIERTRAILLPPSSSGATTTTTKSWERDLPPDTSTLEDEKILAELADAVCEKPSPPPSRSGRKPRGKPLATPQERYQMQRLLCVVRSQLHLRTKLSKIDAAGGDKWDQDQPTEEYVNHLVHALQQLERVCLWHEEGWTLQQHARSTDEHHDSDPPPSARRLDTFLQTGRDGIVGLVELDVSLDGAKRQAPPTGTRRTKRRRIHRDPGHMPSSRSTSVDRDEEPLDVGELDNLQAVERFVDRVRHVHTTQWYLGPCAAVLLAVSHHIQAPVLEWTTKAQSMLGVQRPEKVVVNETKEEEHDSDDNIDTAEENRTYTYDEIKQCLVEVQSSSVLRAFALSSLKEMLEQKLKAVEEFEKEVWKLVSEITESAAVVESDSVLVGLLRLQKASTRDDRFANVEPLAVSATSELTKSTIDDAITIRRWVLHRMSIDSTRQRTSFVQHVVKSAVDLPSLPIDRNDNDESIASKLSDLVKSVERLSSQLESHMATIKKHEQELQRNKAWKTVEEIDKAMPSLASMPFLSLPEEKLRIRRALLAWQSDAKSVFDKDSGPLDYGVVKEYHDRLEDIVGVPSKATPSHKDDDTDNVLRRFAQEEMEKRCNALPQTVRDRFTAATSWKERTDTVLSALRSYGNELAGPAIQLPKALAMVDAKRIFDLLNEYKALHVTFADEHASLTSVYQAVLDWAEVVERVVTTETDMLKHLMVARDSRPKGVMMNPARHVVDSVIDILEWHNKLKVAVSELANKEHADKWLSVSSWLSAVHEGIDFIAGLSQQRDAQDQFVVDIEEAARIIEGLMTSQRLPKQLSLAKFTTYPLVTKVSNRLMNPSFDEEQGHPLFAAIYVLWLLSVNEMFRRATTTKLESGQRPTLGEARKMLAIEPKLPDSSSLGECLSRIDKESIAKFRDAIKTGEDLEIETKRILEGKKEMLRGVFARSDEFRQYTAKLKERQAQFRNRASHGKGFVLDSAIEQSLDIVAKDVNWLARTLPYHALHSDDVPDDGTVMKQVPFDLLVSLNERTPAHSDDASFGDIARVAIRARELYDEASRWQEEVTTYLPLSFRGAKRRVVNGGPIESEQTKVNLSKLSELARDPILTRVAMPREAAVQEVLRKAHQFEIMLHNLLGMDFDGTTDKAPYPESSSLVGERGEFLLYRLTGSPLFSSLKESVQKMTFLAEDLAADTPGKAVFDWIGRAVSWIEGLRDAVVTTSPFGSKDKLVIPSEEAKGILQNGNELFLDVSEETRKTLSNHKIFMSTNKQTERLTVVIGKGGSHHSTGGTAIKWCPLLLEWLKNDIAELEKWEKRVVGNVNRFNEVGAPQMKKRTEFSLTSLYRVYRFFEESCLILNDGADRLVVTPTLSLVASTVKFRDILEKWTQDMTSDSAGAVSMTDLRKQRFADSLAVTNDRSCLLDSLLTRRRIHASTTRNTSFVLTTDGKSFRERACSILEKALRKGMKMMAIRSAGASEVVVHCALKAWELESSLFHAFQEGKKSVTNEYRDKVRTIKSNLEDLKNPTLSARLLANKLDVDELIHMSADEMATQFVRQEPAKAEDSPSSGKLLSPDIAGRLRVSPKGAKKSTMGSPLPELPNIDRPSRNGSSSLSATTSLITKTQSAPPPPPTLAAPPSLAAMPVAPTQRSSSPTLRTSEIITSSSGGDQFSISIANPKVTFGCEMYLDNEMSSARSDGLLPESWTEKGRLQIDEFMKFFSSKMNGGRWKAEALRISVLSGSTDSYRTFYKEYEQKRRIAMFSLNDYKVFLVTPKYHSAAKAIRDQLHSKTHTYAIVLTRSTS